MNLFAFGSNGSGQLAIGHTEDVATPTECLFETPLSDNDEIEQIAAGGNHTLLRTKNGHIYAAGCNTDGRCGPGRRIPTQHHSRNEPDENLLRFRKVTLPYPSGPIDTFTHASATWEGSILVAPVPAPAGDKLVRQEDVVFVMGSSPKGELGLAVPASPAVAVSPDAAILIPDFPPRGTTITALASGMGHSVAVLSNGDVYGWGGSRKGQLGNNLKEQKIVWTPSHIGDIPFKASGAVCGREFTVLLGDRAQGEFVVLGDPANRWGVLDIPDSVHALRSAPVKGFVDIGASWHGIYVHAASLDTESGSSSAGGRLIAWGRNDRGQLPPSDLSPEKIAAGSEHVLALLPDGSAAAFGWGEHGNCGTDTDPRGNVAGTYNAILLPDPVRAAGRRVVGLGAGCATSWLVAS